MKNKKSKLKFTTKFLTALTITLSSIIISNNISFAMYNTDQSTVQNTEENEKQNANQNIEQNEIKITQVVNTLQPKPLNDDGPSPVDEETVLKQVGPTVAKVKKYIEKLEKQGYNPENIVFVFVGNGDSCDQYNNFKDIKKSDNEIVQLQRKVVDAFATYNLRLAECLQGLNSKSEQTIVIPIILDRKDERLYTTEDQKKLKSLDGIFYLLDNPIPAEKTNQLFYGTTAQLHAVKEFLKEVALDEPSKQILNKNYKMLNEKSKLKYTITRDKNDQLHLKTATGKDVPVLYYMLNDWDGGTTAEGQDIFYGKMIGGKEFAELLQNYSGTVCSNKKRQLQPGEYKKTIKLTGDIGALGELIFAVFGNNPVQQNVWLDYNTLMRHAMQIAYATARYLEMHPEYACLTFDKGNNGGLSITAILKNMTYQDDYDISKLKFKKGRIVVSYANQTTDDKLNENENERKISVHNDIKNDNEVQYYMRRDFMPQFSNEEDIVKCYVEIYDENNRMLLSDVTSFSVPKNPNASLGVTANSNDDFNDGNIGINDVVKSDLFKDLEYKY